MLKETPAWHLAARHMHDTGATLREISVALGQSQYAIKYALDIDNARSKKSSQRLTAIRNAQAEKQRAADQMAARRYRILVDPETKMKAARDFAEGLIDREALMRLITNRG